MQTSERSRSLTGSGSALLVPSLVLAGVAWVMVAATHYYLLLLFNRLWLGAIPALFGAWIGALVLTLWAVVTTWRQRGARWGGVVLVIAVVLAVAFGAAHGNGWWERLYATTQFRLHHGDFVAVNELVRGGELGTPCLEQGGEQGCGGEQEGWDYYGAELPERYRHLAANGKVAVVGGDDQGQPVLFLPVYLGIPDGAAGYAHFPSEDALDAPLDLFADAGRPISALGDGWWWVG